MFYIVYAISRTAPYRKIQVSELVVKMKVAHESIREQMLPENRDVTVSELPYINTEPVITAPASTSTISTYTNTPFCTSCMVSRSQTIVLSKEIEKEQVQMPRKGHTLYFAPQVTEDTSNPPKNSEDIYHSKPAHFYEPSILNLSKASETFQDQQSDVLDLSTKQVAFSKFSEPEKQTIDISETPKDTHQTRVKSMTPPDSPQSSESTHSSSPTHRQQPYSPTMPHCSPGSIAAVPEYTPTMRDELPTAWLPLNLLLFHMLDLGIDIAFYFMTIGPFLLVPRLLFQKTMLIAYGERLCRLGSGQRISQSVPMDIQLRRPSLYNRVTLSTN